MVPAIQHGEAGGQLDRIYYHHTVRPNGVESTIYRFPDDREAKHNSSLWIFYYQAKLLFGTSRNVEAGFAATLSWLGSCGFEVFIGDIGDKDYYDIGNLAAEKRFEVGTSGCILPTLAVELPALSGHW